MTTTAARFPMKNEQRLLNLICVIAALGLFAFVAYNFIAAGAVISTDGLFFTVVPVVIALSLLAMPAQEFLAERLEKRRIARGEEAKPSVAAAKQAARAASTVPPALKLPPALKDTRGRALPPDVNRMVAEMNRPGSEQ
ncbi:MAG TPA: hypothetical protein VN696_14585 [Pyrinomonadaceae bacterium]|nr:hypothetical protein [Pyrinomonadaceae bacterium]